MSEIELGAGDAPADDALAELDAMIAEQQGHVVGRRQLSETEVLPAVRAQKAKNGRPAVRARAADPEHGARHRSILETEERRLAALQQVRDRLTAARADREDADVLAGALADIRAGYELTDERWAEVDAAIAGRSSPGTGGGNAV